MPAFDLNDPHLPREIDAAALTSGGFPYHEKLAKKVYERELELLQIELIKLHASLQTRGERLLVWFEGRDAAGKGSAIKRFMAHLNPPRAQTVALSKPTEVEARRGNGISSATCRICRPSAAASCSTVPGTAAPASNG